MKKTVLLLLCVALVLPLCLSACHVADLLNSITLPQEESETTTTTKEEQNQVPTVPPTQEEELIPSDVYTSALAFLQNEEYEEAYARFLQIPDYKDVATYLSRFRFLYEGKFEYTPKGGESVHLEYDAYGKLLSGVRVSSYGSRLYKWEFQYNANQQQTGYHYAVEGEFEEAQAYEYDSNGNLVRAERYGIVTVLEYDERGNIVKTTFEDTVTTFAYDQKDRMTRKEMVIDLQSESYRQITEWEYDDDAHTVTRRFSTGYGEAVRWDSTVVSTYDADGNLLREECEEEDGEAVVNEYAYNQNGQVTRKHYKDFEGNEAEYLWEYDAYGNKTKYSYWASNASWSAPYTHTYVYEYDEAGNVLKKTFSTTSYDGESVTLYEYDEWGNVLKETHPGETDSPNNYRIILYFGYKLYYNPYPVQELPESFFGK